jgi:hypothetical protein
MKRALFSIVINSLSAFPGIALPKDRTAQIAVLVKAAFAFGALQHHAFPADAVGKEKQALPAFGASGSFSADRMLLHMFFSVHFSSFACNNIHGCHRGGQK